MAPYTGFMERSDPLYSFPPASKEHVVEINRVKFNYGKVDCQSFSGVPFFKKYRHITLAKDYTLITFPKGRYAANMQRFHVLCLARGNEILSLSSVYFNLLCRFSSNFIQGRAYTFCRAVSIHFCL